MDSDSTLQKKDEHFICFDEYVDGSVGWECLCGFTTVYSDKIQEHAAENGTVALGA